MPLGAEQAGSDQAWAYNEGLFSLTWDIDMPPAQAFIKVFMGQFVPLDNGALAELGLVNIRSRQADGSDLTTSFPSLDAYEHIYASFDSAMTHMTYGLSVDNCHASLVWTLGFWG